MSTTIQKRLGALLLALALAISAGLPIPALAAPGDYNPGDIAVINALIDSNGLNWAKASPADGSYFPSEKILEMITIDAAAALGWDNEIGSLEAGKKADIITINLLHPRLLPDFNLVHRLIGNAQGSDVDNVFVDGKQLMENSVVSGVDERKILLEGHEEALRTIKRAHLEKFAYPTEHFWGKYKQYHQDPRYDIDWQREDGGYY